MADHVMNELSFALPPDGETRDWTSHVLRLRQNGHPMMLAVNRGLVPAGKSLRQLAQMRVVEEYQRFRGYAVLDQRETEWSGLPALELSSRWRAASRTSARPSAPGRDRRTMAGRTRPRRGSR